MWRLLRPDEKIENGCICTAKAPTPPLPKEPLEKILEPYWTQGWSAVPFSPGGNIDFVGSPFSKLLAARGLGSNETFKVAIWVPDKKVPPTPPNNEANVEIYL